MTTTTKIANRLIDEKSPYLLQHAYNPVNWYPWGDEAFERAKSENKPIFLSIGYSTCHWCHVMEKESFEDNDVANILNESFLAIKVDREERPDIDHIYMNVCQALTGSGGWPLSIFMTADKKPFFAGTYFPKKDRYGMQGFLTILESIKNAWDTKYEHLLLSSDQILNAISNLDELPKESDFEKIKSNVIEKAFEQFKADFDLVYGGFGNAPKFPTPHNLYFLLRYYYKTKNQSALSMVEKTLDSIYRGGIFDHIGFGFSRYSTDRKWLVPHFEKMLYDNALLAIAYLETYQVTKNQKYADIAEKIFTYVTRDMTSKEGGFYSAEDADSEGVEGKFYIFSVDEINSILGENDGIKFCSYYKITSKGNFEGKNILNRIDENKQDVDMEFINSCREKIFQSRENRVHPYKDDKILTAWNGLMIAAMAMSGRILGKKEYTLIAEQAVDFINHKLIREDGRLLARYRDGHAAILAYVDDYAFLIWGLIELYETTYNVKYLKKAVDLNKDLINYFWDEKMGGLFIYGSDSEQLITRPKEIYDGAMPSGNSVAAVNFLRLARLTGDFDLEEKANQLVKAFSKNLKEYPKAYSFSLLAILLMESGSKEVVIVSDEENDRTSQMIDILQSEFHPFTVSIFYSKRNENIEKIIPYLKDYTVVENKSTAYICKNFSCQAPITDIDNLRQAIEE